MERGKEIIKDKEMAKVVNHIYQNAFGNPLVVDTAPSKPADMKNNTSAISGTDFYIRFPNGKLIKFTGTEIT